MKYWAFFSYCWPFSIRNGTFPGINLSIGAGGVAGLAGVAEGLCQDAAAAGDDDGAEGAVAAQAGGIRPDKGLLQPVAVMRIQRLFVVRGHLVGMAVGLKATRCHGLAFPG